MTDLQRIARPVFLNFIDREIDRSSDGSRPEHVDRWILQTLVVGHVAGMSINLHPLTMYLSGRAELALFVEKLNDHNILLNTSSDTDTAAFVHSRQKMYAASKDSVPMFFRDVEATLKFKVHKTNTFSMTDRIRSDIFGFSGRNLSEFAIMALEGDKRSFILDIDQVQGIVFKNKDAAITVENLLSLGELSSFGHDFIQAGRRVLSSLYYQHYCYHNHTATMTGVPGMQAIVQDLSLFPHYDLPVLTQFLNALGFSARPVTVDYRPEELFQEYYSDEHWLFVETLHAFIAACFAQAKAELSVTNVDQDKVQSLRSATSLLISRYMYAGALPGIFRLPSAKAHYTEGARWMMQAAFSAATSNGVFRDTWQSALITRRYLPPVGFADFDLKLRKIRDRLYEEPNLSALEISNAMQVLSPLLNFAGQLLSDNLIDRSISEEMFQSQLRQFLRMHPGIGETLLEHPHVGAGIADLLVNGIPIELKCLADKTLGLRDCKKYVDQTLSYASSLGRKISVLCVLDCSKKDRPPLLAEDCIDVVVADETRSRPVVVVILMQANLRPSSLFSRARSI
ncbi:hypothetical protein [Rhizobium sp. FKL33]|uniref:hypothetical protein n=1 Tax=Rhizobium sp. FKL33 TaxID=2562307 RepID=UPI0010C02E73|nr:hypothetical protein [Rhizobium sp. FKL33]